MNNELERQVKEVMATVFGIDATTIASDASPDSLSNWDSLGHMNLIVALEERFQIRFTDEQMMEMLNLPLILCVVTEQLATA
ncbi:acyl carrier protein [bacterium]|nr:acyl carrier protein [bacterium]